jgi:hypothetical protein
MINLQKAGLVYDLIAKICRQNVPVYDLTAIDNGCMIGLEPKSRPPAQGLPG